MTLLDVIDLDKIWIVSSIWGKKNFQVWAKVGATLVWNLWENQNYKKIFFMKKQIIGYDDSWFFVY